MFAQKELIKFRDDILDVCDKLDVEVDPRFEKRALDSVCVENTMRNHGCSNLEELASRFKNWFIENPDSDTSKHYLHCRTNSFLGDTRYEGEDSDEV